MFIGVSRPQGRFSFPLILEMDRDAVLKFCVLLDMYQIFQSYIPILDSASGKRNIATNLISLAKILKLNNLVNIAKYSGKTFPPVVFPQVTQPRIEWTTTCCEVSRNSSPVVYSVVYKGC